MERPNQTVLGACATHPDATLADFYDPDLNPVSLRKAHQALERAVDRLYRRSGFQSDHERIEHLFMLYEKMGVPLGAATKAIGSAAHRVSDGCRCN